MKNRFAAIIGAGAMLGMSACAAPQIAIPDPAIDIPQQWAQSQTAALSPDIASYWTQLNDPLVTTLVESAIANNRDLAQSAARLVQARASLRIARAGFLPSVNGAASATRDVGDLARDGVLFSGGIDAAWEADLFGQISNDVAAAEADLAAAGYALADLQRLIAGQVAIAAINARALAVQLAIARDTLAFQNENLNIARWRNQAGLVSSLDVEQARTQRAQTAATIPQLESALTGTANAISTLIAEPPGPVRDAFLDIEEGAGGALAVPVPDAPLLTGLGAPAEVLLNRPDVRGAQAGLVASTARVGIARVQLLPLLRLSGNINAGPQSAGNIFDLITGGLMATVTQLIFDGGRTAALVDSAREDAGAALAFWEQTILSALEEVESAAVEQRAADESVAIFEEATDAATNSAILARSQYQAGLTDFQVLLTVENQLLSARNQLVIAEADRAIAFVQLTQALGGGWMVNLADRNTP